MSDLPNNQAIEKIFHQQCDFKIGATKPEHFPVDNKPEFAFLGRSNVGKSSIINTLLNRRIAKTSQKPGHTRQINFFLLAERLYIVDMPGYGYAAAPKSEIQRWQHLVTEYLQQRQQLKCLFLLLDIRHDPKPTDLALLDFLIDFPVSTQIILTKSDKVGSNAALAMRDNIMKITAEYPVVLPEIIISSSSKKSGLIDLKNAIFSKI